MGEEVNERSKYPEYCQTMRVTDANGVEKELVFPKALDLDRPKRARTTFSSAQLDTLEHEFDNNQYLVGKERSDLASRLGLTETQVKVWFQNRRTKHKKNKEKEKEAELSNKVKSSSTATPNILDLFGSSKKMCHALTTHVPSDVTTTTWSLPSVAASSSASCTSLSHVPMLSGQDFYGVSLGGDLQAYQTLHSYWSTRGCFT